MSSGPRSILANAGYRLFADVASKVASLAFFVVMARELGNSRFGIFTFALAFVILATTLGNFGQDVVLTREVARDRARLGGYFANTLALKIVLATISLTVSIGVAAAAGVDRETLEVLLLLGPAVTLELLGSSPCLRSTSPARASALRSRSGSWCGRSRVPAWKWSPGAGGR